MESRDLRVRLAIYRHFAATGNPPSRTSLAKSESCHPEEIDDALVRLQTSHALALAPSTRNLWMAHPFSAVPTPFRLETAERTYFGNCAWDVLSIAPLLRVDARATGRCAQSGDAMEFRFADGELTDGEGFVHLSVPPRRFWENVGYT